MSRHILPDLSGYDWNWKYSIVVDDLNRKYQNSIADINQTNEIEKKAIESKHAIEVEEMTQSLKYANDEKVRIAIDAQLQAEKKSAVLEAENKMYIEAIGKESNIVEVKELVNKLIDKLPSINISSLAVSSPVSQSKEKTSKEE